MKQNIILTIKPLPENWEINPETGLIDVHDNVNLQNKNLMELPYHFGYVLVDFNCSINHLTTLSGSPRHVGGDFNCSYNNLISFEYCPISVGGMIYRQNNPAIDIKYIPKQVSNYKTIKANIINNVMPQYLEKLGYKEGTEIFNAMYKVLVDEIEN